jgi:hypothetical protein
MVVLARWRARLLVVPVAAALLVAGAVAVAPGAAWAADGQVSGSVQCSGTTYQVTWAISNTSADDAALTDVAVDGAGVTYHRSATGPPLTRPNPIVVPAHGAIYFITHADTYRATMKIVFKMGWGPQRYETNVTAMQGAVDLPATCGGAVGTPSTAPATGKASAKPSASATAGRNATFESGCDGSVVVRLPAGSPSLSYTVKAAGGFQQTAASGGAVTVPADQATQITVKATGVNQGPVSWTQPATCASPPDAAALSCTSTGCGSPTTAGDLAIDRTSGTQRAVGTAAAVATATGLTTFGLLLGAFLWRRRYHRSATANA